MGNEPEQPAAIDEELLGRLIPIGGLGRQGIAEIARQGVVEEYRPGQVLFKQGDSDGLTTYLLEGELELTSGERHVERVIGGSESARHPIAQLQPRQYTAKARTGCRVLQIKRQLLDSLLALEQSGGYEVEEVDHDEESDDWMTRLLQSELFQKIPTANIQKIFLLVEKVEVAAGDVIVRQGDPGDYYYFIAQGRCEVTRKSEQDGRAIRLAELREGDSFGEEALITESRRNATISMLTDGVLMRLTQDDFAQLIKKPLLRTVSYAQGCGMVKLGAVWVDARLPEEHARGAIPESINLPLSRVRKEAERLERNRTYIFYCDSGARSSVAAFLLGQEGFDVCYLARGLDACPHAIAKRPTDGKQPDAAAARRGTEQAPETLEAPEPAGIALKIDASEAQIVGKRDHQEDCSRLLPLNDAGTALLAVVADGMGGHAAGDVASREAVRVFCNRVQADYPSASLPELLRKALQEANEAIQAQVAADAQKQGMGCTLVAVLVENGIAWWASVGDSHLYLLRDRQLRKCNVDHSYGGYLDRMAEAGHNIEADPRYARNSLMSALTGDPIPELDLPGSGLPLEAGDRLLLASDGINSIGEGALLQHSAWSVDTAEYTQSVLEAVNEADKPRQDNTTVIALDLFDSELQAPTAEVKKKQRAADQKVLKLNQQLSGASKKLAEALRQKAEAEAARQAAEKKITERLQALESQDSESRKAYEQQLEEERQRREQEIQQANHALEEAQRSRLAAEEARRTAEAQAERIRAEEEEMRRRLQAEAEERLQAERKKMEVEFARFSEEIEQAQRARENAEQQLKDEQVKIQEQSRLAEERLAEAERLRGEAEAARRQAEEEAEQTRAEFAAEDARRREEIEQRLREEQAELERRLAEAEKIRSSADQERTRAEAEARRQREEADAAEAQQRTLLEQKLKDEQAALERRLAEAEEVRQAAEQARRQAEDEARKRLEEASLADSRERQELEEKLKAEQAELERRLAEAEEVRQAAEQARQQAEEEARKRLEEAADAERRQREELEQKLRAEQSELERRLAEAEEIRKSAEEARKAVEEEAHRQMEALSAAEAEQRQKLEDELKRQQSELEQRLAASSGELEQARRLQEQAEEARRKSEAEAERIRRESAESQERLQREAEQKLREERSRMEAQFADTVDQLEAAKRMHEEAEAARAAAEEEVRKMRTEAEDIEERARAEAETRLRTERARLEAEFSEAMTSLESARKLQEEAEAARVAAEQEALAIRAEHEAAGETLRQELKEKLAANHRKIEEELAAANAKVAQAEAAATTAASAQQEAASESARIRAAEEQARMQLQAEVQAQLRAEREKHQQELAETASKLAAAQKAQQEAEAKRLATEQLLTQLAAAEERAKNEFEESKRAEIQAERARLQTEIERANAELKQAQADVDNAAVTRSLAERRASQLEEAEQEAARLKESARNAMEQASREVGRLEDELAEAKRQMAEEARAREEALKAQAEAEKQATEAKTQMETARQVAESFRERERLDREIRVDQKRKSTLPIVAALVGVALIAGGVFLFKDQLTPRAERPAGTSSVAPDTGTGTGTGTESTVQRLPQVQPDTPAAVPAEARPEPQARPLTTFSDPLQSGGSGPEMVRLAGGSFTMGSNDGLADEQPAHQVTLPPFSIGRYEVTFQEYDIYVRTTGANRPSDQTWGRGSNPVINVSWEDAVAYTRWLSKETGKTYRLPTEAEWEYAARGGREVGIWWDLYDDEVHARCSNCDFRNPNPDRPVSVERFPGHPYRLHNTSGNVKEWVQDCYVRGYSGAPADGRARGGSCSERVVRGGSYLSQMQELRASARSRLNGSATSFEIGFRVVREN